MPKEIYTIVILEDELVHAESIKKNLSINNYNVLIAFTISEYKSIIKTIRPDLVFANIDLPDGKAFEILEPVWDKQKFPTVLMTSNADESMAVMAIKSGAMDYIVKTEQCFKDIHRIAERTIREWNNFQKTKNVEKELREIENRYKLLAENVSDTVLLLDISLNVVYASPSVEKVIGLKNDKIIKTSLKQIMTKESYLKFEKVIYDTIDISHPENENININQIIELEFYKKNGSLYWSENVLTFILDNTNHPTNILLSGRDITDRKKAEIQLQEQYAELKKAKEKAEESDRLKSSFLANVSHEIRTPLNGILGFAEFLKNPDLNQDLKEKYINVINSCSKQLLSIITDIIEISKIEAKQVKLIKSKININTLLQNVYSNFKVVLPKEKNLSFYIKQQLDETENLIETDETKLQQILTNLVENAIKFTDYGYVEFGCSRLDEKTILFFVRDSGIGISKEYQKVVFDRFRRVEQPNNESRGGTGLGLAICKSYVELLGGKIWIESDISKGSTFNFTLPISNIGHSNKINENIKTENSVVKLFRDKHILVAEDDDVNYLYLQEILSKTEANFIRAKNGKQAVDCIINGTKIDLVLMDIKMPIMSGIDATIEIRKINHKVPIIAQTAYAFEDEKQYALKIGCNDYISKPIKKDMLVSLIEKYLNE